MSIADELEKLANLRDKGALTEDEFQSQKIKILHKKKSSLIEKKAVNNSDIDEKKGNKQIINENNNVITNTEQSSSNISIVEMKENIKSYFIEVEEDKFTKIKRVKCKHSIKWGYDQLANKLMITDNIKSHNLELKIDYRHVEEEDSVFFVFTYNNIEDGYPHISELKMYLILDNKKTIELDDVSANDHASKTVKIGEEYKNFYTEITQLSISIPDMIEIANSNSIEYSIRSEKGRLEGTFTNNQLNIFKGLYNGAFDEDFELDNLYKVSIEKSGDKRRGGCYIATMAYGSYEHPQVLVLRNFRDSYLEKRKWGKSFISCYYKYSPKLVDKLYSQNAINKVIRSLLDLFIAVIK